MRTTRLALATIALGLIGCANQVEYIEKPVYVDRPIPVPCVSAMPAKPTFAVTQVKRSSNADTVTRAYMVERRQRIAYEGILEAALSACLLAPALGAGTAK